MLRAAIEAGTPVGLACKALMARGELVPDETVIRIIGERYDQPDCKNGAIFDGFPRTIPQALVLELKVDDAVLLSRVEARIKAGGVLRSDDTPETLAYRLGVYYKNTAPLIEFYRGQGKLTTVDGMAPVEAVTAEIAAILDRFRPD